MKLLLVGGNGLLGNKLQETHPNIYTIVATYNRNRTNLPHYKKLDITDINQVHQVVKSIGPDIIIHAASMGSVDYCEKHQREVWKVNVEGTKNLLHAAMKAAAKFVFFSSNAVFNGENPPYSEKSRVLPINFYGKTKAAAEILVRQYFNNSILFRLNTMYGWNIKNERTNPTTWIIKRLKKNLDTPVVTDIHNNHLWVNQAAEATWVAIAKKKYGQIFHIAGKDCLSRFEFYQKVAHVFGLNEQLLHPVLSNYFPKLAPRPKKTCFTTDKMEKILGIQPLDIDSGLKRMKEERDRITC